MLSNLTFDNEPVRMLRQKSLDASSCLQAPAGCCTNMAANCQVTSCDWSMRQFVLLYLALTIICTPFLYFCRML